MLVFHYEKIFIVTCIYMILFIVPNASSHDDRYTSEEKKYFM